MNVYHILRGLCCVALAPFYGLFFFLICTALCIEWLGKNSEEGAWDYLMQDIKEEDEA